MAVITTATTEDLPAEDAYKDKKKEKNKKERKHEKDGEHSTIESNAPTNKPSKGERKTVKRLKRLDKEYQSTAVSEKKEANGTDTTDKATANASRKAEKARLKVKRNGEKHNSPASVELGITNGDATTTSEKPNKKAIASVPQITYQEHASLTALPQSEIDTFLTTNSITITDPSTTSSLRPITQFSYLPTAITSDPSPFKSFTTPTPIQAAAWPHLLSSRDVIGVAETGSGKTLAFGVPCIRHITTTKKKPNNKSPARAIIVSPTRELAVQIHSQITALATPSKLQTACVYGGVPKETQRAALKTAHIIVATPGRLNDLISEGSADLSGVTYLVLDEADRMLDKGFEDAIRAIISTTTTEGRQTLMFTATWPPSVRDLASTFMTQPVHIAIGADNPTGELRANKSIKQLVEVVDPRSKETRLLQLIRQHQSGRESESRILVFCLYKKEASRVERFLRSKGLKVAGIHGDMSQPARSTSLENFKSGSCPLLVATDVAARGLDIASVKVVINVTFPLTVEDYVHRIGRTGRAGKVGLAVTLFTEHDKGLAGGLINVLKAAGQQVPEELLKFGTTVKKRGHEAYGAFYREAGDGERKEGKKIRFD